MIRKVKIHMSREWDDDGDSEYPLALWEAALVNAVNGKRGQQFLKELEAELLAMKDRGEGRLLRGYLVADGRPIVNYPRYDHSDPTPNAPVGCCTLGVLARKKAKPENLEPWLNRELESPTSCATMIKESLNIPRCMIAEIGVLNDEEHTRIFEKAIESTNIEESKPQIVFERIPETDEQRFDRMLKWVQNHISKNGEKVKR